MRDDRDDLGTDETAPAGTDAEEPARADTLTRGDLPSDDTVAAGDALPGDLDELPTRQPARYERGNEIARGGMGRIVAARDRELGRAIALKELLSESRALERRFEREIRITARLQHPAIISVHDAGRWPSGEAFYVMKHVAGEALDKAIARKRTLAERLALLPHVLAVGDALAYAHAERVIHRDLKPANVLVGAYGETVVIDWGLAKDLGSRGDDEPAPIVEASSGAADGGLTVAGEAMGTPAYMPPEQARGQPVDERADVYALGAMLYHLLAGEMPFAGATSAHEILQQLLDGAPAPVTEVAPDAPPDLVAIVDKAMARAPADRYPTASEFAEDVRRFETGKLVGAHDYSTWQLLRRWVARHRAPVAVGALALLALAIVSVVGIQRIRRERSHAQAQQQIAEENRAEVEDLLDFMLTDLRDKLEPIGRLELLDMVAQKAADYYASRSGEDESPAEARHRAVALRNVGDVLLAQGDTAGALKQYRESLAVRQKLAAQHPDDAGLRRDVAVSRIMVGDTLDASGNGAGALEQFRRALASLDELAKADRYDADAQRDLAVGHERVADMLRARGDSAGALEHYLLGQDIAKELAAREPDNAELQMDLSFSHNMVGKVLLDRGDTEGALQQFYASLRIMEGLVQKDPDNTVWQRSLTISLERVGGALRARGDWAGALKQYRESLEVAKALTARDPSNAAWQRDLSISHNKVGAILLKNGDAEGALEHYRSSLTIAEALASQDPSNVGRQRDLSITHDNAGNALLALGDAANALRHYRTSLSIGKEVAASDPDNADWQASLSVKHQNMGNVLLARGDPTGALEHYETSISITEKLAASDPARRRRSLAVGHAKLGDVALAQGDKAKALEEYGAALEIAEALAAGDPDNVKLRNEAADLRRKLEAISPKSGHQ